MYNFLMLPRETSSPRRPQLFCVDGTNLVRRSYGYAGPEFHAQENNDCERLVAALSVLCARHESVDVDLVFDGAHRPLAAGAPSNLRVRFARERRADDLLLDSVRALRRAGGKVTVVTGDGELAEQALEEGARHVDVALERVVSRLEGMIR